MQAVPGGEEAPLALDMGASFGLPNEEDYFDLMPSAYFKNIAMGAINYALGGVVSGIYRPEVVNSKWESNQVCIVYPPIQSCQPTVRTDL
eukprot:COSAG02_NODE_760_length_17479_cov_23.555178_8_plen_90_part_00